MFLLASILNSAPEKSLLRFKEIHFDTLLKKKDDLTKETVLIEFKNKNDDFAKAKLDNDMLIRYSKKVK